MKYYPLFGDVLRTIMAAQFIDARLFQDFYITLTNHARIRKIEPLIAEFDRLGKKLGASVRFEGSDKKQKKILLKLMARNNRMVMLNLEITAACLEIISAMQREHMIEENKKRKI